MNRWKLLILVLGLCNLQGQASRQLVWQNASPPPPTAEDGYTYTLFLVPAIFSTAAQVCELLGSELAPYVKGETNAAAVDKLCVFYGCWVSGEARLGTCLSVNNGDMFRMSCHIKMNFVCRKSKYGQLDGPSPPPVLSPPPLGPAPPSPKPPPQPRVSPSPPSPKRSPPLRSPPPPKPPGRTRTQPPPPKIKAPLPPWIEGDPWNTAPPLGYHPLSPPRNPPGRPGRPGPPPPDGAGPKDYLGDDGFYYYLFSTPTDFHQANLTCFVLGRELVPYQAGGAAKAAADKLCSPLNGNQPDAQGRCWIGIKPAPVATDRLCPLVRRGFIDYTPCEAKLPFICRKPSNMPIPGWKYPPNPPNAPPPNLPSPPSPQSPYAPGQVDGGDGWVYILMTDRRNYNDAKGNCWFGGEMAGLDSTSSMLMLATMCSTPGVKCWVTVQGQQPSGMCPYTTDGQYVQDAKCSQTLNYVCRSRLQS